ISCKKRRSLYIHIIETHSLPLQCPWSSNCKQSNKNYYGILLLQNHIVSEHTDSTIQCKCPIPKCINSRNWEDWSTLLQHIILRHTENIFASNNFDTQAKRLVLSRIYTRYGQPNLPMTIPTWDLRDPFKCSYYNCSQVYWDEIILKRHQAYEHPLPLLCPFGLECQQSTKKYFGL
ncbi:unnamed protein product, partial [Adineta steineri]